MFGLEIMANLVKSLQISLVWFTNITAFTTGDNLSISVEDKYFRTTQELSDKSSCNNPCFDSIYMSAFDIR